jgi:hypothetical protein
MVFTTGVELGFPGTRPKAAALFWLEHSAIILRILPRRIHLAVVVVQKKAFL